jgi:Flp pilus assembly protein TadD
MKRLLISLLLVGLVGCGGRAKKDSGSSLSEMNESQAEAAVTKGEEDEEEPKEKAAGANVPVEDEGPQEDVVKVTASPEYKPLGTALFGKDETQLLREAAKFLSKNPKDLITLNAMAMHYYDKKKPDLAKLILAKALKIYPNSPTVHNNLGLIYLKENRTIEAIAEFRRAQELDPGHPESAANLGSLLVKYRNYPAAVALLQKSYRSMDKDLIVANNYAVALMGVKQFKQAEEVLDGAKAADSNNATVLLNYAILLVEHLKSKKPGLKIVNKIRFLSQDEDILRKAQRLADKAEAIK